MSWYHWDSMILKCWKNTKETIVHAHKMLLLMQDFYLGNNISKQLNKEVSPKRIMNTKLCEIISSSNIRENFY